MPPSGSSTQSAAIVTVQADSLPLIRRPYGRGFIYFNAKGEKIRSPETLKRIKALVIPPMWTEVRICAREEGHIQAVGRDAKGRRQYIYHADWARQRQMEKYAKLQAFGRQLPKIRSYAHRAVQQTGWPREKVLGLLLLILDQTGIRIGNREYLKRNQTHGLTTLRRRHLDLEDEALTFHFKGKSSKQREVNIEDPELIRLIRAAAEQPGYEIFRYREGRQWHSVDSDEINELIHEQLGEDFSSKDFRTWVACRLAVELYEEAQRIVAENPRKKFDTTLVKLVSAELGNTPAVCRQNYLHPTLLDHIEKQSIPNISSTDDESEVGHSAEEKILLEILC